MTEEKNWELVKVPTGEMLAFQDPAGEIFYLEKVVLDLLNKVKEMEKKIG
ncbi:MAG: hypothetical protein PHX47_02520 [Candidatus ainarchaeum sp.]|nr:hypothetical protein [Candidatus ainarchaeum sp.]